MTTQPSFPELENDPLLCDVIEQNIHNLTRLRLESMRERTPQEKMADAITVFSGRMQFVYFHVVWFGLWIIINNGWLGIQPFDPFPYGLLTMVVSLEAIFLATFVLISQNRLSAEADRRADLALHIGLLTEHEVTRVLQMLDAIQDKMGIDNDQDSELAQLEVITKPEDVLAAIHRMEERVSNHK
ncbi:MAG: DUF1003 domain-containing protein [Anaerolineales bacterium]|nr:DUF1003 domain-containing protein [Anaerolineales bacterium]